MTEIILHGYQIILIPRLIQPAEVLVSAPYGDDKRYTMRDLERRIGQLERELKVMLTAKAMLEASIVGNSLEQVAGSATEQVT